mgnify:CR=1 FL=1
MKANLSRLSDDETARTDPECALQRAENLAILGAKSVLELCVGPSLRVLGRAYREHGISVVGNDLERRWMDYYPEGTWIKGDALAIDWSQFDAVVFAPPVTRGCTGRRVDALRISEVNPSYAAFMARPYDGLRCMVLPARSIATSEDRKEFFDLMSGIKSHYDVVPLHAERRRIRKYVDVYYRSV